jgi:hypothetical protein
MALSDYFVVLDEAPIKGHPTPKYELCCGDVETTICQVIAKRTTIKELVRLAPSGVPVYRRYLMRTDGKDGKKLIRPGDGP